MSDMADIQRGAELKTEMLDIVHRLAAENPRVAVFKGLSNKEAGNIEINVLCNVPSYSVFTVKNDQQSFIVKKYSEDADSLQAMNIEYKSLELQANICSGSAPMPYFKSDTLHCIVMEECVTTFHPLHVELEQSRVDMAAIGRIAETIASIHKATYGSLRVAELTADFGSNAQSLKIFQKLFVDPFEASTHNGVPEGSHMSKIITRMMSNSSLPATVAALKEVAQKKECLVHGNLTTQMIVVKDGQIKILGNQFAALGACSFDIGLLIAQYLVSYHTHMLTEENNDAHRQVSYKMVEAANITVDKYLSVMQSTLGDGTNEFIHNVAGFCGVEIVRRAICDSSNPKSADILDSGLRLIGASHRITSASNLVNIALMLTF